MLDHSMKDYTDGFFQNFPSVPRLGLPYLFIDATLIWASCAKTTSVF